MATSRRRLVIDTSVTKQAVAIAVAFDYHWHRWWWQSRQGISDFWKQYKGGCLRHREVSVVEINAVEKRINRGERRAKLRTVTNTISICLRVQSPPTIPSGTQLGLLNGKPIQTVGPTSRNRNLLTTASECNLEKTKPDISNVHHQEINLQKKKTHSHPQRVRRIHRHSYINLV